MYEREVRGDEEFERVEFESVEFETGWFVVRERTSSGENGQWLATRTPTSVEP